MRNVNVRGGTLRSPAVMVPVDRRTLLQCVVLSLLLHMWVVVLFGTATYGGARRDRDFGDALTVSLRALTRELGTTFKLAPGSETASPGTALLPRARVAPPSPQRRDASRPPNAGASRATPDASAPDSVPPAPEAAPPPAAASPPTAPPAAEPLRRLNLDAPEEVAKPYVPPAPPPRVEPDVAPAVPVVPREIVPPPAPREPIVPPQPPPLERESVTPAETKPRETPPPPPAAVERLPPPAIEREAAPAAEPTPRVVPVAPSVPTERIPAPKSEAEPAPPVTAPPPRTAPTEPVARPEPVPPSTQREVAPAAAPPAPASTPAPRRVPSEVAPRATERSAPERAPAPQIAPRTDAAPTESPPRLRFGAPEPEEDMFKPRRDVVTPSIEPGTAPHLDLDDAKKRAARAVVHEGSGSRGMLPVVPPPPERESKEARALEKAVKPDCRTAYANMGLLAAVPLVASAIGNGGCRW